MVPASLQPGSGNLAVGNAKSFLQDGQYKPAADGVSSSAVFERKINGESVQFEVVNSVLGFSDSQWKRVVAVFVNGQEWQFKDWLEKIGNQKKYVELFLRVRGYYLHFQDLAGTLPDIVTKWNIKLLALQRNKRHQDVTVFTELWTDLEAFLKKERYPGLNF